MSTRPVRYREHYCERQHRSYRAVAQCLWRRAVWVMGQGPYATLSCDNHDTKPYLRRSRGSRSVVLHAALADALEAITVIDQSGCGGGCRRDHKLIDLTEVLHPRAS